MSAMTPLERANFVKGVVRAAGFDLVGIARAEGSRYAEEYRRWIAEGKQGEMAYLAEGMEERVDITKKFPWAKSVVCVGLAYFQEAGEVDGEEGGARGKIARYAWGRDYHKVIGGKLKGVEKRIREGLGDFEARAYCDTGPVLERELAARAGLGWVGKHTLLIHPQHGSWFLLGELVTDLEMEGDSAVGDHCGTCRRCIEACPTGAITPYSVDGTKCISYLTLEHRGAIGEEFFPAMREAGYVIGCDICQEVCPFNRAPLLTHEGDFAVRAPAPAMKLEEILAWREEEWDWVTRGRAFRRSKLGMWRRNAEVLKHET